MKTEKMEIFKKNKEISEIDSTVRKIDKTLEEYGHECCVNHKGDISSFRLHLSTIFSGHIISEKDKQEDHSEKIKPILDNIRRSEQDIEDLDISKNNTIPGFIKIVEDKISERKEELNELENNPPITAEKFSMFKYVTLSVVLLLLTASISYFYANIAWVLWGIKGSLTRAQRYCSPEIFNPISELLGQGDCFSSAGVGSLILPIIFLAFAYVIHILHSEESKLKWIGMLLLGMAIIITDVVLAVMFEMKLKVMGGEFGIHDAPPSKFFDKLMLVAQGEEFILILVFGLMSYILWAIFFNYFEAERDRKNPLNEHKRIISLKKNNIEDLKSEKVHLKEDLNNIPQKVQNIKRDIINFNSEISIAKIGGLQKLQKRIDEFTLGWKSFLRALYTHDNKQLHSEQNLVDVEKKNMMKERTLKIL